MSSQLCVDTSSTSNRTAKKRIKIVINKVFLENGFSRSKYSDSQNFVKDLPYRIQLVRQP